ncbi:MAG: hypothetical protein ACKOV8_09220 [Phycisphaerales bacterium]
MGAGQNDVAIRQHVDRTAVVVVPGMGDAVQMDKAGILPKQAQQRSDGGHPFPGEGAEVRAVRAHPACKEGPSTR